jgi:hypothetical protein
MSGTWSEGGVKWALCEECFDEEFRRKDEKRDRKRRPTASEEG